jgi:nicotinate dehydrogenase subunit A
MHYLLDVNGLPREVDARPDARLLPVLRDALGLTGARYGCGEGECGACVVLLDGVPTPSCTVTVDEIGSRPITTIEGLARGGHLHAVQRAFLEEGAVQCGYCTSGMILAAVALLGREPSPSEEAIRQALAPHLCRCGVYSRAVRAVQKAAAR